MHIQSIIHHDRENYELKEKNRFFIKKDGSFFTSLDFIINYSITKLLFIFDLHSGARI
jgi:hypothetical protein